LLQLEIPLETVMAAAGAAKRAGARVILDPAPAPPALPPELFQTLDVLTPNETEAAQLAGGQAAHLSTDDACSIARRLQGYGAKTVIVKLGERGCILADGGALESIAAPLVAAIDTTAAGDVFNAALAVALSEGASSVEACHFAVKAAALSVTRVGAQSSMPARADVDGFSVP
jgi:ribokinase